MTGNSLLNWFGLVNLQLMSVTPAHEPIHLRSGAAAIGIRFLADWVLPCHLTISLQVQSWVQGVKRKGEPTEAEPWGSTALFKCLSK